jgi:phosphoserine phosphatase
VKRPQSQNISLIAFDLDGTLIEGMVYVWQRLHEGMGSDVARRRQAAQDFFAGRIDYRDWFQTDLTLLQERGATRARLLECFSSLRLGAGVVETLEALRARGIRTGIISGSVDLLLEAFLPPQLFDHIFINRFTFDEAGLLNGGEPTPYDLNGKAEGLREMARREGLSVEHCAFVGDNVNDLEVLSVAGLALAINPKHDDVVAAAHRVLGSIPELLALV